MRHIKTSKSNCYEMRPYRGIPWPIYLSGMCAKTSVIRPAWQLPGKSSRSFTCLQERELEQGVEGSSSDEQACAATTPFELNHSLIDFIINQQHRRAACVPSIPDESGKLLRDLARCFDAAGQHASPLESQLTQHPWQIYTPCSLCTMLLPATARLLLGPTSNLVYPA